MSLPDSAMRALSRAEVRHLDRRAIDEFGVPSIVLMENAGRGVAELLLGLGVSGRVVICCGKGNNGGDGFVIARHLELRGKQVGVLLFCRPDELRGDAKTNYDILAKAGFCIETHAEAIIDSPAVQAAFANADWIVDALFGTGLQGPVRAPLDQVIALINAAGRRVLAVDIPSGLDCDTGQPMGAAIRATHTATIAATKKGFLEPAAAAWTGQVHVVDMGVPRVVIEEVLASAKR